MDKSEALKVAASDATVSDKIRALDAAGYPRAEIARLVDRRYQHVRNVLEGDKLARRKALPSPKAPPIGVAEAGATYVRNNVVRLEVSEDGTVRIPPEILAVLETPTGGVLIGELEADRLVILSHRTNWAKIHAMMAPYRPKDGRLISEELIAERRAAAARGE
jgi:hypothetical protein